MCRKYLIPSFLLLFSIVASAQLPVGTWRTHASFTNITNVEMTPNRVFAIGDKHLFSYSKIDGSLDTYSKCEGMSESTASLIKYDTKTGQLVVVYSNSNVDVIDSDGNIFNIDGIYKKNWSVDKTVNNIFFLGGRAYLSTNFGIVVLNLKKYEVKETYIIGDQGAMNPVYSLTSDGEYFYALMDGEVKKAPLKGKNLLDFSSWDKSGLPLPSTSVSYSDLEYFNGSFVLAQKNGEIYRYLNGEWKSIMSNSSGLDAYIHISGDQLIIGMKNHKFKRYSSKWVSEANIYFPGNDVVFGGEKYYIAAADKGLAIYVNESNVKYKKPNGPATSNSQVIRYDNGYITVTPGFYSTNRSLWTPGMEPRKGGIYFHYDNMWHSYIDSNTGASSITPGNVFYDVVSVTIDPTNKNHFFASTWGEGIYEFLNGKATYLHTHKNTDGVLKAVYGHESEDHLLRIDGLCYDASNNLWAVCSTESKTKVNFVAYRTTDGVWHEASGYSPFEKSSTIMQLMFHSNGQHWLRAKQGDYSGLLIKNSEKSVYMSTFIDADGKSVSPYYYFSMAEDKDGAVWVGTSEGPLIFNNCSKIFSSSYRISRVKIPRNDGSGLADYLLGGVEVTAIAVDGGNRKWLGTKNSGVYLVSDDGLKTFHHFTTENSPLPSNDITSIAINPTTGEVFIGTSEGIVGYGGGTTEPVKELNKKNVYVYPNPVTPDYTGMITVVGLEDKTVVKIVDASGQLVFEGKSFGGSLSWDGKNYHGNYVSSGVYFFHLFNTNEDDSRSAAAKVLIIR